MPARAGDEADGAARLVQVLRAAARARPGDGPSVAHSLAAVVSALGAQGAALLADRRGGGAPVVVARTGAMGGEIVRVALTMGDEALGVLELRDLPAGARPLAEAAAAALALVVRNDRLYRGLEDRAAELDRQVRQLVALQGVARAVGRARGLDELAAAVAAEGRRLLGADGAAVVVRDAEGRVRVAAEVGRAPTAWTAGLAAVASGRRQMLPGPQAAVPIGGRGGTDAALAVMRAGAPFRDEDLDRLSGLAEQAVVALENARLLEDLRAEQRRRKSLAAALVQIQERERRRVAEDLHDGPVQELAGLALILDALQADVAFIAGDGDATETLARAALAARSSVSGIRRAIFDLHPMSLEELGVAAAVRAVLDRHVPPGVHVEMEGLEAVDALTPEARTSAFRIVQEAVANACRHAAPHRVEVRGSRADDHVTVEVCDDGVGFDVQGGAERVSGGHLGLAAVRARAVLSGAALDIASRPGEGTRVRVHFPPEAIAAV